MVNVIRTDSANPEFIELVKKLDAYLTTVDGEDHAFYDQFNKIDMLKYVVVAYQENVGMGCGAITDFHKTGVEIKRMYVDPHHRGKGIAKKILAELELWAKELGYRRCILETGKRQSEAIALYKSCGYHSVPKYEPYMNMENSVCFEKVFS